MQVTVIHEHLGSENPLLSCRGTARWVFRGWLWTGAAFVQLGVSGSSIHCSDHLRSHPGRLLRPHVRSPSKQAPEELAVPHPNSRRRERASFCSLRARQPGPRAGQWESEVSAGVSDVMLWEQRSRTRNILPVERAALLILRQRMPQAA